MKKFCLLCAAIAAVAAFSLAGCGENETPSAADTDRETEAGTYSGIRSAESVYGIAAVTASKLLAFEASPPVANLARVQTEGSADAVAKARAEAEDFNKYFNMLDSFFDRGATTTVVEKNTAEDERIKDYAFKLTITGRDAAGNAVPHTMYYSETASVPVHTSRKDGDETVETDAVTYTLTGVVQMDGEEPRYSYMTGTRTETDVVETEGRERETEHTSSLSMRASAAAGDASDYVQLMHTETTEQEEGESETEAVYLYNVYAGGVLTESTRVSFETETERDGTETEYTVGFLTGASRGTYTIEREEENGATEIAVSYSIDGARGTFVIVKNADGTYRYRFSDNAAEDEIFPDFDD